MNRICTAISLALFGLATLSGALLAESRQEQAMAGDWTGRVIFPSTQELIHLTLEQVEGEWQGEFAAEGGQAFTDPLVSVEVHGTSLAFEGQRIVRFAGELAESGGIVGHILLGPNRFEAELHPAGTKAAESVVAGIEAKRAASFPAPLEAVATGPGRDRVDLDALEALLAAADEANTHAMAILHDGELVGQWHAGGEVEPVYTMSLTKPVVAFAVGRLILDGKLESLDTPVHSFFPQWADTEHAAITVRHLMNHSSGLAHAQGQGQIYHADNAVQFALNSELLAEPGSQVQYNNNALNLLAGLVGEAAGRPMDEYLNDTLFEPMGISDWYWARDPAGNPRGMDGLGMTALDLARLGQLMLNGGEWEGEQLVDADWAAEAVGTRSHEDAGFGLIWMLREEEGQITAWMHSGSLGQYLVILPQKGLVGVRQIAEYPAYDRERDGFRDFSEKLTTLVKDEF